MKITVKVPISTYTMKMRLYPSKELAKKIDDAFRALHVAYNMTFHEVFERNPEVCTDPNKDGYFWPDFKKMAKAEWKKHLIELNPIVGCAPAAAITTKNGLLLSDAKRAWMAGMHNLPVTKANRKDFRFYSQAKPRSSFMVQTPCTSIISSTDNPKVVWIKIPGIGKVKARGFNRKLWFGENKDHMYEQAVENGELAKTLTLKITKDRCGDYFASLTISDGKKHEFKLFREMAIEKVPTAVGIDVGIKDVAILDDGTKYPNSRFKKEYDGTLRRMNHQLSRRWGPTNRAYRDYNKDIREKNKLRSEEDKFVLAVPSNRYKEAKIRKARLERKIWRKRDSYQHQISYEITSQADIIATETLMVKNMMKNHKLAYALADAGMSEFVSKIKYKADRKGAKVITIGNFEPSSQLCHNCGYLYEAAKDLSVRFWKCPQCGSEHDRDINAAKNILAIAMRDGGKEDKLVNEVKKTKKRGIYRKPRDNIIIPENPNIVIRFSKELTTQNNPRYVIVNKQDDSIIDDAQGNGYRSISNAKNCYKAKMKWKNKQ